MINIEKKTLRIILISGIAIVPILVLNFIFFRENTTLFSSINIIALLIFMLPTVVKKYMEYRKTKEVEEMFIVFLRDFVESIRGGMTVPYALKSVSHNDYKALTPYVKKMSAQMDWGISVEKVFLKFSKKSKSKLIGRIVSSVIESHRFGGTLAESFDALSATSLEVERLRAERRLYLHSQMITGYIIFFVFLAVIISLGKFLIPSLSEIAPGGVAPQTPEASEALVSEYRDIFRNLILLQGFFAGLTVGKMSEGALIAGLKHSLFMMFVGIIAFILVA